MAPIGRWGIVAVAASAWLLVITVLALHRKYMMATICLSPFVLLGLLYFPEALNWQTLRALLTINGGEEDAQTVSTDRAAKRDRTKFQSPDADFFGI